MNSRYYISTGVKSNFYTLRYSYDEAWGTEGETIIRDYHIKNLSTDKDEAIAKARAFGPLAIDFDVLPIGTRRDIDWSILQGGKFAGKSIHEVREIDANYLVWLCENCADSRAYTKTVELARALVAKELAERQDDRDAAEDARLARAASWESIAAIFDREFPQHVQVGTYQWEYVGEGRNGYVDDIVAHIRAGRQISSSSAHIIIDNVAKLSGRRNSKAYAKAYDELLETVTPTIKA
jgi:hypothetical protein